jgi:hypothetical protein
VYQDLRDLENRARRGKTTASSVMSVLLSRLEREITADTDREEAMTIHMIQRIRIAAPIA